MKTNYRISNDSTVPNDCQRRFKYQILKERDSICKTKKWGHLNDS